MGNAIKIVILGDICPTEDYRKIFDSKAPRNILGNIVDKLKNADVTIANLEAPATKSDIPIVKCGPNLKAKPEDIELLKNAGINVLSLANNHILDYGEDAVIETLNNCKKQNIRTVGCGKNKSEAAETCYIKVRDKIIGIMSFAESEFNLAQTETPGANHFDCFDSLENIKVSKKNVDYLIVLYHGGIEYYKYPSPLLQKKCRKMVEYGADLVLCQHSHCIGTIEKYNKSTIVYGQGNSVFGYRENDEKWNEGLLVQIDMDNNENVISYNLINATQNGVDIVPENKLNIRINQILDESNLVYDVDKLHDEWDKFCKSKAALYFPLIYGKSRIFNIINRIFNNLLIDGLFTKRNKMITLNLIRCEAHNEVVQRILENSISKKR